MPDPRDPKYVPLWVPPDAEVQPMMDKQGGYLSEKPQPQTLEASLSGAGRPNARPPVSPQVVAQAVSNLKAGAPKKKEKKLTNEDMMKMAKELQADVAARNAAMAAQPTAVAPAAERMRAPEGESVADRLYRESAHWKGPTR